MSPSKNSIYDIFKENFGALFTQIRSGNYTYALPISTQNFDLSAILPAIFYMFRFGERRGHGGFLKKFGGSEGTAAQRAKEATIERVAQALSKTGNFHGFENRENILGDLLLSFTLENIKKERGRDKAIRYAAPTHYFASWIDLPFSVANLRFVPETIVSLLADQSEEFLRFTAKDEEAIFPVGRDLNRNPLLKPFIKGMKWGERASNKKGDNYDETIETPIDELLTIRLGQYMESAPAKIPGARGKISNQRPIARKASEQFSEDLKRFTEAYAENMPRQNFLLLLESAMSIGLTTIISSTFRIASHWLKEGKVLPKEEQSPLPLFIDVSNGINRKLKNMSEVSIQHFLSVAQQYPTALIAMQILDYRLTHKPGSRYFKNDISSLQKTPYATEWLNFLGDVMFNRHKYSYRILERLDEDCDNLADTLEKETDFIDNEGILEILKDESVLENSILRLAKIIVLLKKSMLSQVYKLVDSAMFSNRINGLLHKKSDYHIGIKNERTVILNHSVLEYLVHQLLRYKSPLSFQSFIDLLKEKYGFYIDEAPPGMDISHELLYENRILLEQRLRLLGFMHDVSDAETMKILEPYFQ